MLIQLTCHAPNAPDVGYLLGKHPGAVFTREFSGGTVTVFYPEVAEDHITVAMLTDVDPVALVRGPAALARLDQYVNDRPYVASSLTSVALNTAFSSALAGKSRERPERVGERMHWEIMLPAVACDAGEELIARVFAPLGYAVTTTRLPLDPAFPAWGEADVYSVTLVGEQTTQNVLTHFYVLLPVLDNTKHYYVSADETEKLLDHGGAWLAAHPERGLIVRRYLRYKRTLVTSALARLAEGEPAPASEGGADGEAAAEASEASLVIDATADEVTSDTHLVEEPVEGQAEAPTDATAGDVERSLGLHDQRLQAVMAAVRAAGAASLVDLGCGEGKLLRLALKEPSLTRILGIDVSSFALSRARRALRLDSLPTAQRARIEIAQGSLLYRDRRLEGFDTAALVEVVEHLDAPRLGAMERVVFAHARPRRVVITTPNREYNAHWPSLGTQKLRHRDHRFEWTRAECQAWSERVAATHGYRASREDLGPCDPDLGAPSQLVIFDRRDGVPAPADGQATSMADTRFAKERAQ
jgi:SAM-dependent methyltransferase